MSTPVMAETIQVETAGAVAPRETAYARERIAASLADLSQPVLYSRVRLTQLRDPALARPALAQVNVDLNGRLIRAQAARETMAEAIDEVRDRLRDRARHAASNWEATRGGRPTGKAHEWRHESRPTERPPYFDRPAEDRRIVRHKAYSPAVATVDEAAFDMEMLGYDFHLFTEKGTGADSVLYRTDEGGLRLAQTDPHPDEVAVGAVTVSVSPHSAAVLTIADATARLTASGWPFVFFRDADSRRGSVVYHRYDGHYGLITPVS